MLWEFQDFGFLAFGVQTKWGKWKEYSNSNGKVKYIKGTKMRHDYFYAIFEMHTSQILKWFAQVSFKIVQTSSSLFENFKKFKILVIFIMLKNAGCYRFNIKTGLHLN